MNLQSIFLTVGIVYFFVSLLIIITLLAFIIDVWILFLKAKKRVEKFATTAPIVGFILKQLNRYRRR